ncbi:MAG: hypothetical protein D6731_14890 [Planctomycetota bacterium]|nr:MAG: hypothetical protein D6731_14890 [Planctomycetota bacterium]
MSTPGYEAIEQAEAVAVRVALERGYLSMPQLREALLLREQLRVSGQPVRLLQLLGARYIRLEHQPELSRVYFRALREPEAFGQAPERAPAPPPAEALPPSPEAVEEMMASSADELAIPEFVLAASSEQLERPPTEDPPAVAEFLARSGEVSLPDAGEVPPTRPSVRRDPGSGDADAGRDGDAGTESGLWRWLRKHLPG